MSQANIYVWPAILKARGERNTEQNLELKSNKWPSCGASYSFDRWIISLDHSLYDSDSDNGNVSITTEYSDYAVWGGYSLFQGDVWDLYAVVGTGVYQQKVETTIGGLSVTNRSHDKSLIGMGAEYLMKTPPSAFAFVVGARFNWTQDLEPEIMPEVYLKLGVGF